MMCTYFAYATTYDIVLTYFVGPIQARWLTSPSLAKAEAPQVPLMESSHSPGVGGVQCSPTTALMAGSSRKTTAKNFLKPSS